MLRSTSKSQHLPLTRGQRVHELKSASDAVDRDYSTTADVIHVLSHVSRVELAFYRALRYSSARQPPPW